MTPHIPSARNVHHVGFAVPDLDEAIRFYTDVLGCEMLFRTGPFQASEGFSMADSLGVEAEASLNVAMLRCGPVTNVELLEWRLPGAEPPDVSGRINEIGAGHLAFHVTDMEAAVAYLREQPGVRVLGAPMTVDEDQPSGGSVFVYFLTPWGQQLELLMAPPGMPYETTTSGRLFGPADAWAPADADVT
jgi:catechol 2,3-dioxygenase-like lactoylglutathione lyase family enzyme